jgi:hypothetical protein
VKKAVRNRVYTNETRLPDFSRDLENLSLNLSPTRRETLNLPPSRIGKAGWFHTTREKLKLVFKASLRLSDDRLTPTGRGLERGQNLWFYMRNQD